MLLRGLLAVVLLTGAAVASCSTGGGGDAAPDPAPAPGDPPTRSGPGDGDPDGDPGPAWQPLLEPAPGGPVTDLAFDPADPSRVLVSGARAGVGVSTDGGATWSRAGGLTGWEVASLTWHPRREGEVWAATMSGPQLSLDGGETWHLRRQGLPATSPTSFSTPLARILVDPVDGDRLLAFEGGPPGRGRAGGGPGGRIWQSLDGGASWAELADLGPGHAASDATFLADGATVLATTHQAGAVRSIDGGRTWAPASEGLPHLATTSVAAHPSVPGRAWITLDAHGALTGGVLRTDDGGRTWEPAVDRIAVLSGPTPAETSRFAALAVAPSDPGVLYTSDLADGRRAVYRSGDGGRTWRRLPAPAPGFYRTEFSALALAVAPDDPDRVLAAQEESLFASDDGGHVWRDIGAVAEGEGHRGSGFSAVVATAVEFAGDGSLAIQGRDGAPLLVRRPDGSWQAPLQDWDSGGGGYDVSIVAGVWWALLGQDGTFNGVARSTDNGLTWEVLAGGDLPDAGEALEASPHSVVALSEATALVTMDGAVHRTHDGGSSWTTVSQSVRTALLHSPRDPEVVYGAGPDGVARSRDGGRTFEPIGGPGHAVHLALDGDGRLYAVRPGPAPDAGLWRWDQTWRRLLEHPQVSAVAVDPGDAERVWVATSDEPTHDQPRAEGVLETADGGHSWRRLDDGLGVGRVAVVAADPSGSGLVVAGTAGGGFYQLDG